MGLNIPWELFSKQIKNELTAFEKRELELWRESSELHLLICNEILEDEDIKKLLLKGAWESHSKDWEKVLSRINHPSRKLAFNRNTIYTLTGLAAACIIIIGLYAGFQYFQLKNISSSDVYSYIYSPRGQRTQVVLPDQTKVWLNSGSSLKYPVGYNLKKREVILEGEAFFEVKKDPLHPFLVNANEIRVKVYGTSFNLKAFPDEKYIETTLVEGSLSVTPLSGRTEKMKEIYLKPKEKLIYERSSQEIKSVSMPPAKEEEKIISQQLSGDQKTELKPKIVIEKKEEIEEEKLWKDGKLIFKNETFEQLAVKLERWYDVKIHFMDGSVKNYVFTGAFEKETINQAMEALVLSSKKSYKYKMEFRDIYIKK